MPESGAVGKRARRVADTRARIVDVALDLYVDKGFAATTIDEIAAAAQIGRSSFFRYFDGKEAVVFAPVYAQQAWLLDQLRKRPLGESPVVSIATICVEGPWPKLRRNDLGRMRKILGAETSMADALFLQLASTFSARLFAVLRERAPQLTLTALQMISSNTITWCDWAIRRHLRDGGPLEPHFAEIVRTTATLAGELTQISGQLLSGTA